MQKREIIATLLDVSNELDSLGMYEEADVLTRAAQLTGLHPTDVEFNPDNDAVEHGMLGEERYEREEAALREMRNEEALMELEARIEELKRNPAPTEEDIQELEQLLNYRMSPDFDSQNVQWPKAQTESDFAQDLAAAGADVAPPSNEHDPFADE